MDSGYTTQQNIDRVASPRPLTHSEHTSPQASNIDDNESGATSGGLLSPKTGGENEVRECGATSHNCYVGPRQIKS